MTRKTIAVALAIAVAIPAEGLRQKAYKDTGGILTVCYGSTANVDPHKKYSLQECRGRLDKDMAHAVDQVEKCAPGLPENVLAAFSDAVYNMGSTIACHSTAATYLRAGKLVEACNQLPRWNKVNLGGVLVPLPGLSSRREKERQLCLQES